MSTFTFGFSGRLPSGSTRAQSSGSVSRGRGMETESKPGPETGNSSRSTSLRVLYLNYEWDPRESPGALTHIRELSGGLRALGHTVIVRDRHRVSGTAQENAHQTATDAPHREL